MRLRANRELTYMSRMLRVGDEFDATPVDAKFLMADATAEQVAESDDAPRRGRSPKVRQETPPPPTADLEAPPEKTVAELRDLAEARGIELPPGYVRRDELMELIKQSEERAAREDDRW